MVRLDFGRLRNLLSANLGTLKASGLIDTLGEASCDPVVVVLGARAHQIRARTQCDAPCRIVENAAYRSGRASSLRIGGLALEDDAEAVLIASVDGPSSLSTTATSAPRPRAIRPLES